MVRAAELLKDQAGAIIEAIGVSGSSVENDATVVQTDAAAIV